MVKTLIKDLKTSFKIIWETLVFNLTSSLTQFTLNLSIYATFIRLSPV